MLKQKKANTLRKTEYKNKEAFYLIIRGLEVGIAAGLVSVLYRFLLENSEKLLTKTLGFIGHNPLKIVLWFVILLVISFIVYLFIKFEPLAGGSGIPQVNAELKGYFNPSWWKVIVSKFIGGSLSNFGGLSLGTEGPSVQLGSMAAKGAARLTKADKTTELRMISCGAGAGLAAAFNVPIAGILFILEGIEKTFDKNILCMGIVSTITADYISKLFYGQSTIFHYETQNFPLKHYWMLILLGILLGLFGAFYNKTMSFCQDMFKKMTKLPQWGKLMLVFTISGIVSLTIPQILGGGHSMLVFLLNDHPQMGVMIFLLITKFLFNAISVGSGAPGGSLTPLLIIGTYCGAIYGTFCINTFKLDQALWEEFVVIAMAGLFASIVRSPITGIILVFEMTGNMNNLLPLATVALISYATANLTGVGPIFEIFLTKLVNNKTGKRYNIKDEKIIKSYIIPIASKLDGKCIKDIDWSKHCVIITIHRGEQSITPNGDTKIYAGDELVFLVSQRKFNNSVEHLEKLFTI